MNHVHRYPRSITSIRDITGPGLGERSLVSRPLKIGTQPVVINTPYRFWH
jgi:hypothetical protein